MSYYFFISYNKIAMSLIPTSPMLMSKFLYILKRKYKDSPEEFEKIQKHCGPYPLFRLYIQFTNQDPARSETYGHTTEIKDDLILKFQMGDDQTEEGLKREPWSKCIFTDDIDIISLLYKRVVDNAKEHFSDCIGTLRFGIKGTYEDPSKDEYILQDLMHQEISVNRNVDAKLENNKNVKLSLP